MKRIILVIAVLFSFVTIAQEAPQYRVKHLDTVNKSKSDFGVSYYGEDQVIFASSRKGRQTRNKKWEGNQQPFLQLFTGKINAEGDIIDVQYFSDKINTKVHESNAVFSSNLSTVYFTRNNYYHNKFKKSTKGHKGWNLIQLYRADVGDDGEWGNITPMPFNSVNYQTGHPSLSKDGTKLYFTSDMPGGLGLTDIWVVDIDGNGGYGEPVNLGTTVNSASKEMFPFISENDRLFFSSNRGGGSGGLDVYVSALKHGNDFGKSTNLGGPLNSTRDDFSLIIDENTSKGYFSSNRDGGKGDDDIYSFEEYIIPPPCDQIADGVVRDKNTGSLLPGALVILYDMTDPSEKKELERVLVGDDAGFAFDVVCETSYLIVASKEHFAEDSRSFTSTDENEKKLGFDLGIDLTMNLEQILVEERGELFIKINPIYFDLDKSDIRSDAALELDQVIKVMRQFPNMVIEGGSHTDARGSDSYNEKLSTRRANSTVEYIISRGIDRSRISARGYGESALVNDCTDNDRHTNRVRCSESQHQLNRRTEFKVIRIE